MDVMRSIKTCLDKSLTFSGRASRSEFWWFVLFLSLVNFIGTLLSSGFSGAGRIEFGIQFGLGSGETWWTNIFTGLFTIPYLSAMTRRLNDTGFPVGKFVAVGIAGFTLLSYISKLTHDQVPIVVIVLPILTYSLFFIYLLARKSHAGANIHGPNPTEVQS